MAKHKKKKSGSSKKALIRVFMPAMRLKLKRHHIPIKNKKSIEEVSQLFHDHIINKKPYTGHLENIRVESAGDPYSEIFQVIIDWFKKIFQLITDAIHKSKNKNKSPEQIAEDIKESSNGIVGQDELDMHKLSEHEASKKAGLFAGLSPVQIAFGLAAVLGIVYVVEKK